MGSERKIFFLFFLINLGRGLLEGKAMHLNKPLMVFSLQGDRVIGVSGFNGMAEECIIDQKVSLALNIDAWRFFFFLISFL